MCCVFHLICCAESLVNQESWVVLFNEQTNSAMSNRFCCTDANVLVLAPMFPSINQPWMDTYLEQLCEKEISFCVVSENISTGKYHQKVNLLGLLDYVIRMPMERYKIFNSALFFTLFHPLKAIGILRCVGFGSYENEKLGGYIRVLLRSLYCASSVKLLKSLKVIHAHSEYLGYYFLAMVTSRNIPLILTFHGLEPHGLSQIALHRRKEIFEHASEVLVNTNAAKQQIVELGCPDEKITILPQGLPLEDFPFVPRGAPTKADSLSLLTVGRFHHDKGQRYAILALRRLIDNGANTHWHFVGAGPDKDKLESLVCRLELIEHATFHEDLNLEEIRSLYQKCHLFVLPSLSNRHNDEPFETQGVVLQEAQASGCIPIATRVGGIPECLNHKVDSILVKDRSSRAIFDAVKYLLNCPDEWNSYQKNGRHNVEQNFSASVIGQRMSEILYKLAMLSL